jgi:hypothetical protein
VPLPLLFGTSVAPFWNDPAAPARLVHHIEDAGLDLITVQDHSYQKAFADT